MTKQKEQNWKKAFRTEFGIHFKDSSGELGFAITFIEDELTKAREEERGEKEIRDSMCDYWYKKGREEEREKCQEPSGKEKEEYFDWIVSSTVKLYKQTLLEKIEKMEFKRYKKGDFLAHRDEHNKIYNEALNDIKEIIKETI